MDARGDQRRIRKFQGYLRANQQNSARGVYQAITKVGRCVALVHFG